MKSTEIERLRVALADRTGTSTDDWYLTFKARYGMATVFAALKTVSDSALADSNNDSGSLAKPPARVVTQLYTCCTAVDPVIVTGFAPKYAEINVDTLSIDPYALVLNDCDRALILQHTFGIIDHDADRVLATRAREADVILMEDSAHCLARLSRSEEGEPLADISFHSFGVEKIATSTRFGGAVWVNPALKERSPVLDKAVRVALESLTSPSWRLKLATRLYRNEMRVLSRLPRSFARPLQRVLHRARLFEPAISPIERAAGLEHDNMSITPWVAKQGVYALAQLADNEKHRKEIVNVYLEELSEVPGIEIPFAVRQMAQSELTNEMQPLLLFPIHLNDDATTDAARTAAHTAGAFAKRWYKEVLFPGVTDFEAYAVPDDLGISGVLTNRALGLPTDVTPDVARKAARAIVSATR